MTMAHWGPQQPQRPVGMPPHSPRPLDLRKTPHGLHLAITIILALVSFGLLAPVWVCVWFVLAVVNDSYNHRERKRYERELREWQEIVVQWQFHSRRVLGYELQLPPGW